MAHINRKFIDKYWLVFIFRGVLALVFGMLALGGRMNDIPATVSFVSVFLLAMGIIDSSAALYNSTKKRGWFTSVIDAAVDIVAAVILLTFSNNGILFSLITIAVYTFVSGMIDIMHSCVSTIDPTDRFIRIVAGVCGAIIAFVVINAGDLTDVAFVRFFGSYMTIVGACSLIYGVHNRSQLGEDHAARKEAAKKTKKSAKAKSSKKSR